uniref:DUF659 domain-containing protein n=1 Tax=Nelumbo nucifera TaxID=4432 RepID=A0A822YC66_NELNU|nr:TPA_asm: hypothetical protein HUJ06_030579 [Nelumbo nucifera]
MARCGPSVKSPTPYEIMDPYLDKEESEIKPKYGLTILCDGWISSTRLSIINFMVYCNGKTIFHTSIDLMAHVINKVGPENVVQIVTDNGSNFLKAEKRIMDKYNIFWTPCAAHCLDLMIKDIRKRKLMKTTIDSVRKITNFIYNHGVLLAMMRKQCEGDIVRPGVIRFATNFIALESIKKHRQGLRNLFNSREWEECGISKKPESRKVEEVVYSNSFWDSMHTAINILVPIYKILRMVDGDTWPTMGSMYEAIRLMKESIRAITRSY